MRPVRNVGRERCASRAASLVNFWDAPTIQAQVHSGSRQGTLTIMSTLDKKRRGTAEAQAEGGVVFELGEFYWRRGRVGLPARGLAHRDRPTADGAGGVAKGLNIGGTRGLV